MRLIGKSEVMKCMTSFHVEFNPQPGPLKTHKFQSEQGENMKNQINNPAIVPAQKTVTTLKIKTSVRAGAGRLAPCSFLIY